MAWLLNHLLPERQVKRHRGIGARCKAIVFIERLGRSIFGVDDQREGGNLFSCFQAARYGEADERSPQS